MLPPAVKNLIHYQRQLLREIQQTIRDELKSADSEFTSLRRESDLIVRAYCLAHEKSPSARRRKVPKKANTETENPYTAELRELVERAQRGDQSAMPELRQLLNDTPELWKQVGDLAKHVETVWIKLLSGNHLLTQECLHREAERRRDELLGDDPTPIQRHLIECIVASWLQLRHAEVQMANSGGATEQRLNFVHKRLESAQKQHRAAINQLTKIRQVERATRKQKAERSTSKSEHDTSTRKDPRGRVVAA